MDSFTMRRLREARSDYFSFVKEIQAELNPLEGEIEKTDDLDQVFIETGYDIRNPNLEDMPDFIQDFIATIKDLPTAEKVQEIHRFTLDNFTYIEQNDCGTRFNFKDFMNDHYQGHYSGDCDNYAFFEAAVLNLAGEKDVAVFGGNILYRNPETGRTGGGGHAVALVEDGDDIYMLDLNMRDPVKLDEAKGAGVSPDSGEPREVEIERAMMAVMLGNLNKIMMWKHPDDHKVYSSNCGPDAKMDDAGDSPIVLSGFKIP